MMRTTDPISVMLLDDNRDLVELYKEQIEEGGGFRVTTQTDGRKARELAERQLFDILVIDAKLTYRGILLGGLILADDLDSRYGRNSILVISRFITQEELRDHGAYYEFIEKSVDTQRHTLGQVLCARMREMRQQQYVFVAMPFDDRLSPIYKEIRACITACGFQCVRADEVAHNRSIHDIMFELISKCKLVVFLADGGNCNAYYEAGFAEAMRKEVVIIARSLDELKFDIRNRHTITYGDKPSTIRADLKKKLQALRHAPPMPL